MPSSCPSSKFSLRYVVGAAGSDLPPATSSGDGGPQSRPTGFVRKASALSEASQWLLLGRLLIAVLSIVMALVAGGGYLSEGSYWAYWVYMGAFAYLVLDLVWLFATSRVRNFETFVAIQVVGDLAIATALLYFTGGIYSPFFFLFFAVLLAAGTILRPKWAMVFCVVTALCAGGITVVYGLGLNPEAGAFFRPYAPKELIAGYMGRAAGLGGVGVLTVILNRRLSVARILSSEILDSTGEGLVVFDGVGKAVYESAEFRSMNGQSYLGRDYFEIPPFSEVGILRDLAEHPDTGPVRLILKHSAAEDSRPFLVDAHAVGGDPERGVIVRFQDLSISERLAYAERRVERYRVVADTARNIAHEIRNPLASINVAFQELFRGLDLPADRKELVSVIRSEVRRLDRSLEAFLDFSRPREPQRRLVALRGLAEETADIIHHHEPDHDVEVVVDGPSDLTARLDPDMIRQALLNVGLNAVQAGAKHVRITLLPQVERKGSSWVVMRVEDDGPGMGEDVRRRVFEPFFTTRTAGTGLGLPMVQKVVEEHGGFVEVESTPGGGSIFSLYLVAAELEGSNG